MTKIKPEHREIAKKMVWNWADEYQLNNPSMVFVDLHVQIAQALADLEAEVRAEFEAEITQLRNALLDSGEKEYLVEKKLKHDLETMRGMRDKAQEGQRKDRQIIRELIEVIEQYLPDTTMMVLSKARKHIGEE